MLQVEKYNMKQQCSPVLFFLTNPIRDVLRFRALVRHIGIIYAEQEF